MMRALSNAAKGCCYEVKSYEQGLALFEREAVLSLRHRAPRAVPHNVNLNAKLESLVDALPYTVMPAIVEPVFLAPTRRGQRIQGNQVALPAESVKRLMEEFRGLVEQPLPNFEVMSEDLSFWCILFCGEPDTPYAGRYFVLYADFALCSYPQSCPELRFHTPVYHCNVNSDGRVCLDALTTHSWKPSLTMREVLQQLCRLMREPNAYSAINSVSGTLFRENRQLYLQKV